MRKNCYESCPRLRINFDRLTCNPVWYNCVMAKPTYSLQKVTSKTEAATKLCLRMQQSLFLLKYVLIELNRGNTHKSAVQYASTMLVL